MKKRKKRKKKKKQKKKKKKKKKNQPAFRYSHPWDPNGSISFALPRSRRNKFTMKGKSRGAAARIL